MRSQQSSSRSGAVLALLTLTFFPRPLLLGQPSGAADVEAHLAVPASRKPVPVPSPFAAVLWLTPLHAGGRAAVAPSGGYTLVQKDKQFSPHLLVVPVGATVRFPNLDPFFHNVFSLFDGHRFDLGLYEAGSTRTVTFSREGVSYLFCNIHPQMSAVILSLATPYYAIVGTGGEFHIPDVPPGTYVLRIWVEGEDQAELNRLSRGVQVTQGHNDLGTLLLQALPQPTAPHTNKFGQPYVGENGSSYE